MIQLTLKNRKSTCFDPWLIHSIFYNNKDFFYKYQFVWKKKKPPISFEERDRTWVFLLQRSIRLKGIGFRTVSAISICAICILMHWISKMRFVGLGLALWRIKEFFFWIPSPQNETKLQRQLRWILDYTTSE